MTTIPRSYITSLEERIAFLESQLPDYAEDHFEVSRDINGAGVVHTPTETQESGSHPDSSLVDGVAYLSLYASGATDAAPEPHFLGSSSGATIARFIQSTIFRDSDWKASGRPASRDHDYPQSIPESSDPLDAVETVVNFPQVQTARMLFDTFFDRIHTRWPLLNRGVYEKLFERQYTPGALSLVQKSTFHLMYAITARFLLLTRKPCGIEAEVSMVAR